MTSSINLNRKNNEFNSFQIKKTPKNFIIQFNELFIVDFIVDIGVGGSQLQYFYYFFFGIKFINKNVILKLNGLEIGTNQYLT